MKEAARRKLRISLGATQYPGFLAWRKVGAQVAATVVGPFLHSHGDYTTVDFPPFSGRASQVYQESNQATPKIKLGH